MRIERNLISDDHEAATATHPPQSRLEDADVNFFSSQMEGSARAVAASSLSPTPNLLVDAANQLNKATSATNKSLRAYSKNDLKKERDNYSAHLSESLLLNQMLTKSIGKTAQCIEKICNLQ